MNPLILVVDDEPDVEDLFRQQFRRDLRAARFTMDFARSAMQALEIVAEAEARPSHTAPGRATPAMPHAG